MKTSEQLDELRLNELRERLNDTRERARTSYVGDETPRWADIAFLLSVIDRRATPPAPAVATEGALPALDNVIENDPALKEAFEIQRPKSYVRRQAAALAIDAWTDAGGHVWQLRPGINCVECPHCLFTFAAEHRVAPDGYDCPNCAGCPDADMKYHNHDKSSGAGGDELLRTAVHALESYRSGNVSPDLANEVIAAINAHFGTPASQPVAGSEDRNKLCPHGIAPGQVCCHCMAAAVDYLRSPVAGKCVKCGHRGMVGANGWCRASDPAYQTRFVECGCKCEFSVPKAHTAANCEVCAAQQEASALGTPYSVSGHSVPTVDELDGNERGVLNVLAGNYHGAKHEGEMLECKLWPCRILIEATARASGERGDK